MARGPAVRVAGLHRRLIAWYRRRRRRLPWRRSRDPYRVWVSEIMLHQTRVDTAVPYYERFLRAFPTVRALARARLDRVMKAWEGLGYYARARNLHSAARIIVRGFNGRFPRSREELRRLPGVGRYTAGAICAIAFGLPEPAVDANIRRVVARVYDLPRPSAQTLETIVREWLSDGDPREGLQALMDLGATICTPRKPRCNECPIAGGCLALRRGHVAIRPLRAPRPRRPHYHIGVGVVWRDGRILIAKRKPEGLLGGLWEFPGGKQKTREPIAGTIVRELKEELDIRVQVGPRLVVIPHEYSHFRVTLHVFECRHRGGTPRAIGCTDWRWVRPSELDRYAFPAANRKIIDALRDAGSPRAHRV